MSLADDGDGGSACAGARRAQHGHDGRVAGGYLQCGRRLVLAQPTVLFVRPGDEYIAPQLGQPTPIPAIDKAINSPG